MAYSEAQKRATMKWDAEHYDRIVFTAPKGFNEEIKEASKRAGMSKRQFIIEAIKTNMEGTK